ncbi:hypothetical protein N865_21465, partial [Intrasporangium oryzae NRRL B-24470]
MIARLLRRASIGALALTLIGATAAVADDISNNLDSSVDATAEVMSLNVGGPAGSTILRVIQANGDGKQGCNLTGSTTLSVTIASSNAAVATVTPSSATFTSCSDTKTLTVTPGAIGSATISLTQTSNTTGGTFNLAPATFTVDVAGPSNTAPVVTVTGVKHGDAYPYGSVPTAGCTVNDAEDGHPTVTPTLSAITGPNASDGLGSQTATCSYTDMGGLTSTVSATYTIVKAASVVTVKCDPANVTYTGTEQTPCTAVVTGSGGLSTTAPVTYADNTNAGTATATASFGGDPTHLGSTGSASFTIGKAPSTSTVTCPAAVAWTGDALTPCTAKATGTGNLIVALTPIYTSNTAVGTATASAAFGGDDNHFGSSDSTTFDIQKADSVVALACPKSATYTGSAIA